MTLDVQGGILFRHHGELFPGGDRRIRRYLIQEDVHLPCYFGSIDQGLLDLRLSLNLLEALRNKDIVDLLQISQRLRHSPTAPPALVHSTLF